MKQIIKLPERLGALIEYIEDGAAVADIGTDHGFLPVFLAQTGVARRIIASDISASSLEAALKSALKYGVTEKITFIVAPGLDGVAPMDIDTVVIAGIGGETMIDVLERAPWLKHKDIRLVLQPQSKIYSLFRFLYNNDYTILQTKTIYDKKRQYTIIIANWRSQ